MVEILETQIGDVELETQALHSSNNHRILAHRGLWSAPSDQNSAVALRRALELGFGIETDIRDYNGGLVVSHDIPTGRELPFAELASLIRDQPTPLPIALNIKSDGLADAIARSLPTATQASSEVFYFDMSVPQYIQFRRLDMPVAIRQSEYEAIEPLISLVANQPKKWVWLDAFNSDWWLDSYPLENHDVTFVVVSPELHGRPHERVWQAVKTAIKANQDVYICTDFPLEFSRFLDAD